jgi:MoxR-like ATPase
MLNAENRGASMAKMVLEVIHGQHTGARFPLASDVVTIGKEQGNIVCLEDVGVSRRHARVIQENGGWIIEDLNSRNGTLVMGKMVTRQALSPRDEIVIGQAKLRFMAEAEGAEAARPETRTPADASRTAAAAPAVGAAELGGEDSKAVEYVHQAVAKIKGQMSRVIIGQTEVIDQVLISLFCRGHCLLVGVPGLAKTLLVRTLGQILDLESKRIQFTPDLMPSDITGTQILEEDPLTHQRTFRFVRGPIFTNILLADEINRTPPKTQAALLEAMQEGRVTAAGTSYQLTQPFLVLATQNPIEQEGTYPLPEAQLDRFMFMIKIVYPARQEEIEIYRATTADQDPKIEAVLSTEAILKLQRLIRRVPVSDHVTAYTADLVRATRPDSSGAPDFIKEWLTWGAGPRAGQYLLLAAKARAVLLGRLNVSCEDIKASALPVLRHRIFCNFTAASQGVDSDKVIAQLLEAIAPPTEKSYKG